MGPHRLYRDAWEANKTWQWLSCVILDWSQIRSKPQDCLAETKKNVAVIILIPVRAKIKPVAKSAHYCSPPLPQVQC